MVHIERLNTMNSNLFRLSTSNSASFEKKGEIIATDNYFKRISILNFSYIAYASSSTIMTFDIYSKVLRNDVRIYEFLLWEVTIGMSYMFMDVFIKQYTRKIDFGETMTPLLRGVTIGILMQTVLWLLLNAIDLADTLRFLASNLRLEPSWSQCHKSFINVSCLASRDIILRCRNHNHTKFNITSAHLHYMRVFSNLDRGIITTKSFIIGIVWICNFFFATITKETLLKFFKLSFIIRSISTLITGIIITFSDNNNRHVSTAISEMLDINAPKSYTSSLDCVVIVFSAGVVGIFDFGTMSSRTMIDNAVLVFTILFTITSFLRSFIVKMLFIVLTKCVEIELDVSAHYLMFAILPLSTEFLHAQKFYVFYIYINLMVALYTYLVLVTLTTSKLLHSEFHSVKNMYIVGMLCFLGFSISVAIAVSKSRMQLIDGLIKGLNATALLLASIKMSSIMWIYGVDKFSNDIEFWLGFKPTKFWKLSWSLAPIVLFSFHVSKVYELSQCVSNYEQKLTAGLWMLLIFLLLPIYFIKTVAKYLLNNNFIGLFVSSPKYGPPDREDREMRRHYDEFVQHYHKICRHDCLSFVYENTDCNHLPLMTQCSNKSELSSMKSDSDKDLTPIYQAAGPTTHPSSSEINIIHRIK